MVLQDLTEKGASSNQTQGDATRQQQIMSRGGPVTITPASFNVGHRPQEDSYFRRSTYPQGPAMSGAGAQKKREASIGRAGVP